MSRFLSSFTGKAPDTPYCVRDDTMLLYFLSNLDVRTKWLESQISSDDPAEGELLADIKTRSTNLQQAQSTFTTADQAWNEAYSLERMMSLLEPVGTLITEIRRRLEEAANEGVSAEPRLRAAFALTEKQALDSSKSPPKLRQGELPSLRMLLLDVLEETHWTYQRKFHARPIQKNATVKIVSLGLLSFLLTVAPYILIFGLSYRGSNAAATWTGLPLYSALTAGLFGSFFSRLLFMQSYANSLSMDELRNARQLVSIFLRGSVGMCGALIVFFFLQSGIISANFFPKFAQMGLSEYYVALGADHAIKYAPNLHTILPNENLALLIVWCFLAGFSERLVPSILSSTESTLLQAAKGAKR